MNNGSATIRHATTDDAKAVLEIYRPFVQDTAISFETEPPTLAEMAMRIEKSIEHFGWLVAQVDGQIAGYAYGSSHRPRAAYDWSVETSAYLHPEFHRQGIASELYTELFEVLTQRGFGNAFAGITTPNDASISFHTAMGFTPIGVFPNVGRKFDQWHDVAWMSRVIQDQVDNSKRIA